MSESWLVELPTCFLAEQARALRGRVAALALMMKITMKIIIVVINNANNKNNNNSNNANSTNNNDNTDYTDSSNKESLPTSGGSPDSSRHLPVLFLVSLLVLVVLLYYHITSGMFTTSITSTIIQSTVITDCFSQPARPLRLGGSPGSSRRLPPAPSTACSARWPRPYDEFICCYYYYY